jgi:hypothetical protein
VDIQRLHQLRSMYIHRLHAQAQLPADCLPRVSFRDQLQDFALAWSEGLERVEGANPRVEQLVVGGE